MNAHKVGKMIEHAKTRRTINRDECENIQDNNKTRKQRKRSKNSSEKSNQVNNNGTTLNTDSSAVPDIGRYADRLLWQLILSRFYQDFINISSRKEIV